MRVYKHLLGPPDCTHPRHDPTFPFQQCPDCGSYLWGEMIELQAGFDREKFMREVRSASLVHLQRRYARSGEGKQ